MPKDGKKVALPYSERFVRPGSRAVRPAPRDEEFTVTVYVRRNPVVGALPDPETVGALLPQERTYLTDHEFEAGYGADASDIEKVVEFAKASSLRVIEANATKRSVLLQAQSWALQSAFGVQLHHYEYPGGSYRGRIGYVYVPAELAGVIEAIFGFDNRPLGKSYLRRADLFDSRFATGEAAKLPPNTYLPTTIAGLYRFPPGTDGSGETVAVLAFNDPSSHGGYSIPALERYFGQILGMSLPTIKNVVVHGQGNDPGTDDGSDLADSTGEVMLDIQMVGAAAPKSTIVVYFSQFTEQGWVDVINAALIDRMNHPSVLSISYGNPEDDPRSAWTVGAIRKVNEAFHAGAAKGLTVCCASGDDGSRDQGGGLRAHADFPASSPYVLGCGGTRVLSNNGAIAQETVWNDGPGSATGGGISRLFPVPAYQAHVGVPPSANPDHRSGRGVPDVAGLADPNTGVVVTSVDGQHLMVVGGTSATAPLWSALIARLNQDLHARIGFFNPILYLRFWVGVLRDIVQGGNGAYVAGPGWDACSGLGSPDGVRLLDALQAGSNRSVAGAPSPMTAGMLRFMHASENFAAALYEAWLPEPVRLAAMNAFTTYEASLAAGLEPSVAWHRAQAAQQAYVEAMVAAFDPSAFDRQVAPAYGALLSALRETIGPPETVSLESLMVIAHFLNESVALAATAARQINWRWLSAGVAGLSVGVDAISRS